jgi:hypothetical protein
VFPVKYDMDFYIPKDILHSDRREYLKSYIDIVNSIRY